MQKSESIAELAKALSAFQGELQAAPKESTNPFYHSRYADLAAVWETCRTLLAANGLAVSQLPHLEGERIILTTLLLHASGQWLASDLLLTPSKLDPQAVGSAITYARRYALCAMLGVVADADDDAEAAMGRSAQPSADRMPQSMAVAPRGLCPIHHVPFQRRVGTGTKGPYAFWACPQKVGAGFCKEKPTEGEHTGEAPTVTTPDPAATSPAAAVSSPTQGPEHEVTPQKQGASPTKPAMTFGEFWAEWRADKSLPQGSSSEARVRSVIGKPLTGNWYEGLDLAAVLVQCRQLAQKEVEPR